MDFVLISDINSMMDQTQITYLKLIFQIPHVIPEQCYCTSSIAESAAIFINYICIEKLKYVILSFKSFMYIANCT